MSPGQGRGPGGPVRRIGRITTSGQISEYPAPMGDNLEEPFTTGPDGRLWAVSNPVSGSTAAEQVDAITTQGAFTHYPLAGADVTGTGTEPFAITTGSDGNIWAGGFTTTPQWGIYR